MNVPLVSVSGVRGIVGESFTEELVHAWVGAFAQHCHPERSEGSRDSSASPQNDRRIVLGRDTRPSGDWAIAVAAQTLQECGVQPIIVGIVPTPTVQLAVTHHRAVGGLIITASHNPAEWNGMKFLGPDGVFLSVEEMEMLHKRVIASEAKQPPVPREIASSSATPRNDDQAIERHIGNVLALPIDAARIRARKFRTVLDPVNGTGGLAVPPLLEKLGCTVTVINGEPNGQFAHPPEPTPANLQDLGAAVREQHADFGVAVDPDADRLVLVDERGEVLSEEYTVTLATLSTLSNAHFGSVKYTLPKCVVVNLSTTRMIDDVSRQFGATVVRTPVGERYVVEGMRQHHALIGGEGNGGVIFPKSHEGRDSLVGITLILDLLARRETTLAHLAEELPRYVMVKEKLPRSGGFDTKRMTAELRSCFPEAQWILTDGIRIDIPAGWVHLRLSNTEPVIRLIAEARTREELRELCARSRTVLDVANPSWDSAQRIKERPDT